MDALRILHSESSKGWGGQEHRTLKEMTVLRARGHSIEMVCPIEARLGVRAKEEGFVVHHARMRGGADVASMLRIKTLLSRGKFDVLNTHSGHDSIVAGTAGRLAGTPLVVRTRHLALPITSLATYTWIPHRIIAVSRHVRDYLISVGVAQSRVETIYDGIVKPEALFHSTLRNELGLGTDAIIACMVAIVRDKKGHEDLIDAVQPMLAERPHLHVVMAGDGPWFDKIKNIIDSVGLSDRIHLLGFRTDIPNVLRGCDFFVLPTHQEALGQSYIEAMAAGLPVIGTDVNGVPEVITHGENGLLVPPHDIEALRAAMSRLIDNPELRVKLGCAGRLLTNASFTIDGMAEETIDFYRRGIRERGPQA
ncbi:glycosyltransferase family 4 protein [Caballeronia sordidicola]|uniref:Glycosyltransferase n=1 Tax=Caballeronia sordidicola TaxID=196367 RepID=A0A226WW61_CABSO|nr:glycosyltransferase family 4 protein [Caballeronia sordidicola]OXC75425.1 Glycosyltransferase [Caballeronia sordidicola]